MWNSSNASSYFDKVDTMNMDELSKEIDNDVTAGRRGM
jgi:hypothetical protein